MRFRSRSAFPATSAWYVPGLFRSVRLVGVGVVALTALGGLLGLYCRSVDCREKRTPLVFFLAGVLLVFFFAGVFCFSAAGAVRWLHSHISAEYFLHYYYMHYAK